MYPYESRNLILVRIAPLGSTSRRRTLTTIQKKSPNLLNFALLGNKTNP